MGAFLIRERNVRALARALRPGLRISRKYLERLEREVEGIVRRHVRRDAYLKTLREDSFR